MESLTNKNLPVLESAFSSIWIDPIIFPPTSNKIIKFYIFHKSWA